jgi:hypothetical protein
MITNEGFRDVSHIGRHQRVEHYSIRQELPWQNRPLIKRRNRTVVPGRLAPPHRRGVDKVLDSTDASILDRSFSLIRKLGHVVSFGEAEGRSFPNLGAPRGKVAHCDRSEAIQRNEERSFLDCTC